MTDKWSLDGFTHGLRQNVADFFPEVPRAHRICRKIRLFPHYNGLVTYEEIYVELLSTPFPTKTAQNDSSQCVTVSRNRGNNVEVPHSSHIFPRLHEANSNRIVNENMNASNQSLYCCCIYWYDLEQQLLQKSQIRSGHKETELPSHLNRWFLQNRTETFG